MFKVYERCRSGLGRLVAIGVLGCALACVWPGLGLAASLSQKDVQITAKALGFLDPPPGSGVVAIVYAAGNAASKADAAAIAALFGDGVAGGSATFTAKMVDGAGLGDGSGFVAVVLAANADGAAAMAAAKAHHIPCITADNAAVQGGGCIIAIQSEPKVDITVSHAAASAAGVSFSSAFRMLIHEI